MSQAHMWKFPLLLALAFLLTFPNLTVHANVLDNLAGLYGRDIVSAIWNSVRTSGVAGLFVRGETADAPSVSLAYSFDFLSSTRVNDYSGNNYVGFVVGLATTTTEGKYGNALSFKNEDDGIISTSFNSSPKDTTYEYWIYVPDVTQPVSGEIFKTAPSSVLPKVGVSHEINPNGLGNNKIRIKHWSSVSRSTNIGVLTLRHNIWHHIAHVVSGNTATVYLNGAKKFSKSGIRAIGSSPITIGYGKRQNFIGKIDNFRVYKGALTPTQVSIALNSPIVSSDRVVTPQMNVAYKVINGVSQDLLSLDLYPVGGSTTAPIVVYVHGGGWMNGDKSRVDYKPEYFNGLGAVFVSVNYRLSPDENVRPAFASDRIRYPVHPTDVASALAWVKSNAESFGGDPTKITIIGHSAGAGIVSLLGTDASFLQKSGVPESSLRCAVVLDGDAYDVESKATEKVRGAYTNNALMYHNAFATPEENKVDTVWNIASPVNYVKSGAVLPSFFIVTRGSVDRVSSNTTFVDQVLNSGNYATLINTGKVYDHEEVNQAVGDSNDALITPQLTQFFQEHCR
jgi:arylformamidase